MKKRLFSAAGLMAVATVGLQNADAQQKNWNLSANVRGFYDDNYATSPSAPGPGQAAARDSLGFELSPSAVVTVPLEQTSLSASYTYSMRYFEDRPQDSADHSHQLSARLNHNFSPRYRVELHENFVLAQEPQLLDPTTLTRPLRSEGNNLRNTAGVTFGGDLTRLFGVEAGYTNSYYDFEQRGPDSLSARLDRIEHQAFANLRWNALPTTIAILGYQYGITEHQSGDLITSPLPPALLVASTTRDNRSHYLYVGVDQNFTPQLNASLRIGGQFIEFPNAVPGTSDSTLSPYVDLSGSYSYGNGNYVQLGVKHNRVSTDVNTSLDQEVTSVYAMVNHKLTAKLTLNVLGQYQRSLFNQGAANGLKDNFASVGINLNYEINQFLAAETGYNLDRLDSDINARSFTRNRVYIGLRASY